MAEGESQQANRDALIPSPHTTTRWIWSGVFTRCLSAALLSRGGAFVDYSAELVVGDVAVAGEEGEDMGDADGDVGG
ncbi:unnamed protein product [Linum tenue]|uniref:Uncharacterized protein n=1 Tax=Linum tenue TaxID=586396 RepID=A0AAV0KTX1_9ROSI|nr:unnamed protein product [Linum tenue]